MIYEGYAGYSDIFADGFTGVLLGLEGIADAAVILHGPTGCRAHHSSMSEYGFPRDVVHDRLNYADRFYFGQPRIPTTYLDGDDYVFGASEKLRQAIRAAEAGSPGLLAVVNAPGAALIGEDLRQCMAYSAIDIPGVVIEMPALSRPMAEGYQQAVLAVLETIQPQRSPVRPKTVSLIGISIAHSHWAGSLSELRRLLALCGIEVLCVPGAGSRLADWYSLSRTACHAVIHAEYAGRIADWLTKRFDAPVMFPQSGAPIGFEATEQWVVAVAEAVGADPAPALSAIREQRRDVSRHMSRISGVGRALKGMTCSIQADPSIALPLSRFVYEYLGMLPVSVATPDCANTGLAKRLKDFLTDIGCMDIWQEPWQTAGADFLFSDGHQVNQRLAFGCFEGGIELVLPLGRRVDFVRKPLLGAMGAAYLVETIVNGVPDYF
ncbi:MAG: nitrogenase [Deltaproteobacteria bacterium]|jgi:nitrogenase molybdenum-iron protein alpha/beta subunit|nr:nitrogenase [Deltaproteobacteria bacterium]